MLPVIHGMISFTILDYLLTANDPEEKAVVSLKEMNNAETGEVRLAFFLFNQWRHRLGPNLVQD